MPMQVMPIEIEIVAATQKYTAKDEATMIVAFIDLSLVIS